MTVHTNHEMPEAQKSLQPKWKNAPTLVDLKQNFQDAQPDHQNHTTQVSTWLDNLHVTGAAQVKKKKNRSSVVPKVIRKQAEWRYSSLTEPFLSTEDVFNCAPVTANDKKAAEQNQLVLNHQFNNKLDKVTFINDFVYTAVDEGTVVVRTGWAFEERIGKVNKPIYGSRYDPIFAEPLQEMMDMATADPVQFEKLPQHMKDAITKSQAAGQPMAPFLTGEFNEVEEMITVKNHPTAEVCDYRNLVIDPTCQGDLSKAQFITWSFETSLSDLKKEGDKYSDLDKIDISPQHSVLADPDHAGGEGHTFVFVDDPRKKLVAYEYWGWWDFNDTGIAEPFVATWIGNTMIRLEENPYPDRELPFVKVQYLPKRKKNYGEPDGALLEDNQKIVGAVTRGMIDIIGRSSAGQRGTKKDFLDVSNRRKFQNGEDYEYNPTSDPRLSVYIHKFDEIPNSAPLMLQQQHADAESLTGVKTFASSGITGAALGETASLGRSALDAASKRELGILRRLAAGMVQIARKWTAMNAEFLDDEEVIRITDDQFIEVKRDDLSGEIDIKMSISTAEEDEAKAKELAFMLQTVGPNSDPKITFMIMADIAKLRKMPAVAEKLENYEPTPDPIAQEKAQLENEMLKAEIQVKLAEAQKIMADAQLSGTKQGTEVAKAENLEADTDSKNLDFVEQESGTHHARDMDKQGAQAKANADLEVVKAVVNGRDDPKPQ